MKKQPIFIVSTGRSGSKMIANALAKHHRLFAIHEPRPHLLPEAFAVWNKRNDLDRIKNSILSKREDLIRQIYGNSMVYVESAHYCSHLIPYLHELFNAKFIYIYRDGRSFVRSGLERKNWYPEKSDFNNLFIGKAKDCFTTHLRRKYFIHIGDIYKDHRLIPPSYLKNRLTKITWLWCEINNIILRDLHNLPDSQYMCVALEQIDQTIMTQILKFIEVGQDNLENIMKIVEKKPNKTQKRTIPVFEEWPEEDKETFWNIASQTMKKLHYI